MAQVHAIQCEANSRLVALATQAKVQISPVQANINKQQELFLNKSPLHLV